MLPNKYIYPAVFTYEEDGQVSITFPDLDCATCAESDAEAFTAAKEMLAVTMLGLEEDGETIPPASDLRNLLVEKDERAVLVEVSMTSVRLEAPNHAVSRTVSLPAWLNAAAIEAEVNVSHILQNALMESLNLSGKAAGEPGR
jgi:predicted RNase H-like HicB family nuclease